MPFHIYLYKLLLLDIGEFIYNNTNKSNEKSCFIYSIGQHILGHVNK